MTYRIRSALRLWAWVALAWAGAACGEDAGVAPDPDLESLVGDWTATSFYVEHAEQPDVNGDLMEMGATFTLNIQPSGQYTAVLTFSGTPFPEIGELEVDGSTIVFDVKQPCCSRNAGTYSFEPGHFRFEGPTENDFNNDGVKEPARLEVEMVRP